MAAFIGQGRPLPKLLIYNKLSIQNLFAQIIGDIQTQPMVEPPHILLEREKMNYNVVKAIDYGALNFKLENTKANAWDYKLRSLLEVLLHVSMECWRDIL